MSELSSIGANSGMMGDMKARLDSAMEQKRAQIKEMLQSMDMDLTADMVNSAKQVLEEDATKEDMENFLLICCPKLVQIS